MDILRPVRGGVAEVLAALRDWDAADDPGPLAIETTGSTGEPKRVRLSRAAMRASVDATHHRLGGEGQWVLNLPPTYVAGVQVLYRCVRAGMHPVVQEGDLASAAAHLRGSRGYLSLVPTQLVRLLRDPRQTEALTRFDAVLVGGGPMTPRLRAEAEHAGVCVLATYGMSETCGGCVYDGNPLIGVALKITSAGEVAVAGPMLFDGYENAEGDLDVELTASARDGVWLHTHDLGELDGDGRLTIVGRSDQVVVSGGVKVPTLAVEQLLAADLAIDGVAVVGMPDPEWGQSVTALVQARDQISLTQVRDLVSPREWAPRRLAVCDELPRFANGKTDYRAVRRLVGQREADGRLESLDG